VIVVHWIRALVGFWINFIIGDDATVPATVAVVLATWELRCRSLPSAAPLSASAGPRWGGEDDASARCPGGLSRTALQPGLRRLVGVSRR
jgi:hypothetical protein